MYIKRRQILQPHIVVIIDCSTTRTSFDPIILDLMDSGVRFGISVGNMRFVSIWPTIFMTTIRVVKKP